MEAARGHTPRQLGQVPGQLNLHLMKQLPRIEERHYHIAGVECLLTCHLQL